MDHQLASVLVGSTFDRINVADVKGLMVAVPPRAEQNAISDHLDGELRSISRGVEDALRGIELLREFRTRLIADVVTGKVDVREAAAKLPSEGDENASLEGPEAFEWLEEETEVADVEDSLEPIEA